MQDIHDIRPPVLIGLDPDLVKMAGIIAALLALAVVIYLLYRILKRMKKDKSAPFLMLPIPPAADVTALKTLDSIAHFMKEDPRIYYFRLTALLKAYIGKRYNFNAPEMTSQELTAKIPSFHIEKNTAAEFRQLLTVSDGIKYAKQMPSFDMMETHDEFVRRFVALTREPVFDDSAGQNAPGDQANREGLRHVPV